MICLTCGKFFTEDYRKSKKSEPRFCSRACANKRARSPDYRAMISLKMRESQKAQEASLKRKTGDTKVCPVCKREFYKPKVSSKQVYCSRSCYLLDREKGERFQLPPGGYREGSGNSKSGRYKGIYCGSTYELIWVIYQLDHNLPFSRFPGRLNYNNEIYIPDFLQNEKIIEIKGYYSENVEKQKRVAEANGYEIQIKYKRDLEIEFEYFNKTYKIHPDKAFLLYEDKNGSIV